MRSGLSIQGARAIMKYLTLWIKKRTIREQLALSYTIVFMTIIVCTGTLAYKYLEISLGSSMDATLAVREERLADEVSLRNNQIIIHDLAGEITSRDSHFDSQTVNADINGNTMLRVLDAQGNVVHASPAFTELQLPADSISKPLHGQAWVGMVHVERDLDVQIYSQALTNRGKPFAILQVGESLAPLRAILREQAIILFIIAFIVVILSASGSFWLTGLAFTPIQRLTSVARKIQEGNLNQRVPIPIAHDEVYDLAVTLNEMIERLESAFTRQRRFVADASHELRTPVAAIRSKTDIALLDNLTPSEYISVLQKINGEAERLGHLISDLLALARSDEQQTHLEYGPVQLDFLLEAVAANAEVLAQERQIDMNIQIQEAICILGDESRLIQAIMNLIDNALIYTPDGGKVTLTLERNKEHQAQITIADTGEGIASEHIPHIFERFYRIDQARTRREGGSSGLGLSIVDWIIRAHHGKISVQSQLGYGTIFTITLPDIPVLTRTITRNQPSDPDYSYTSKSAAPG